MNKELQRAQDMLGAMQGQRDNALNTVVMYQAEIADLRRELTAAQAKVVELQKKVTLVANGEAEPLEPVE